jgi:hypothetical protein
MKTVKVRVPSPGSPKARGCGCTCHMVANCYGAGRRGDGRRFGWLTSIRCPLHRDGYAEPVPEIQAEVSQ